LLVLFINFSKEAITTSTPKTYTVVYFVAITLTINAYQGMHTHKW